MNLNFRSIFYPLILVGLLLQSPAQAKTSNLYYNFGSVQVTYSKSVSLNIHNNGASAVTFSDMRLYGSAFHASPNCPDTLKAGESCDIVVRFSPPFDMFYSGTLYVSFIDGDVIQLDMDGHGY